MSDHILTIDDPHGRFTFGKRRVFKVIDGQLVELTDEQIAADDEAQRLAPENGSVQVIAIDRDAGTIMLGRKP